MAEIRADEISRIMREQIKGYGKKVEVTETGTVLSTGDGIARVYGLEGVMAGELVEFPRGTDRPGAEPRGGLRRRRPDGRAGAPPRGRHRQAHGPHRRRARGPGAGRAACVDALGQPIDGKGPLGAKERRKIEVKAPGIVARESVKEPMQTGHQGHRRDGPHRPRTARADHRRPPDRQDRRRDRHDPQPEGQQRRSASTSPSARSSRRWPAWSTGSQQSRRHGVHASSSPRTPPTRRRCSSSRPTPA